MINRNSDEADRAFRYWLEYNRKKFAGTGLPRYLVPIRRR